MDTSILFSLELIIPVNVLKSCSLLATEHDVAAAVQELYADQIIRMQQQQDYKIRKVRHQENRLTQD